MLSNFTNSGQSRSIIFLEGPYADGWFAIAKILKKVLIEANKSLLRKTHLAPRTCTWKVSGQPNFADFVRGGTENSKSSALKGWRCRNCGSWDALLL